MTAVDTYSYQATLFPTAPTTPDEAIEEAVSGVLDAAAVDGTIPDSLLTGYVEARTNAQTPLD